MTPREEMIMKRLGLLEAENQIIKAHQLKQDEQIRKLAERISKLELRHDILTAVCRACRRPVCTTNIDE